MNINFYKKKIANFNFFGLKLLDSTIFYGGKFVGRFIFPIVLLNNYRLYVNCNSYYPECILKKKRIILFEQLLYIFKTGEINKNYFLYGFDRKDKTDFDNYVPFLTFIHQRTEKNQFPFKNKYSPFNYFCLLRDKFIFEGFCRTIGINTPQNIGIIDNQKFYLINQKQFISIENIINYNIDVFCKKNIFYGGGLSHDIFKLIIHNKEIFINGQLSDIKELMSIFGQKQWIIQERISNQAEEFAVFHSHSINTARIVTVKKDNNIDVLFAFLRLGVNNNIVDNWTSGGISVGIDIENGTLEKWGFYNANNGTKTACHPNSKIEFQGIKLAHWAEIVDYVKRAHILFYGFHSVGWDVAVTDEGIFIIEGNDNWSVNNAQVYRGIREKFNKYFLK